MRILPPLLLTLLILLAVGIPGISESQFGNSPTVAPGEKAKEITEVFHVGRVGHPKAAETRELLIDFFREIETQFNEEAIRKFEAESRAFAGSQVRVIEDLKESDGGRSMYIVAYQGQPSVFVVGDDVEMKEGELTIPLQVEPAGTHQTKVTRVHVEREDDRGAPSLEPASSGGATFFGIPVGGSASPAPAEPEKMSGPKFKRTVVTEVKSLPKFEASPSVVELKAPPVFSKDIFLTSLKNGELFELKRMERRRCENCGGFKRIVSDLPFGKRAIDGKMACPECKETGKVLWDVTYQVTW